MRQLVFMVLAASAAVAPSGCSLLGIQPPRYKLVDEAKEFRQATAPPAVPRELAKQPLPAYVVEPGDSLLVQVADLDSPVRLPGDQPVLPDGTIELGVYGRPVVAGKTVPEIEGVVQQAVQAGEKEKVRVTARLIGRKSKVFYVYGEVNAPGAYPLDGRETVLDGVFVAGGLTRQANDRQIILTRPTQPDGCRVVLPVCFNQIVQLGDTATNYQLQPGDRIFVPSGGLLDGLFPNRTKQEEACGPCGKRHVSCGGAVGGCPPVAVPPVGTPGTGP